MLCVNWKIVWRCVRWWCELAVARPLHHKTLNGISPVDDRRPPRCQLFRLPATNAMSNANAKASNQLSSAQLSSCIAITQMLFVIALVVIVIVELKLMRAASPRKRTINAKLQQHFAGVAYHLQQPHKEANIKAACNNHQLCNKVASSFFFPVSFYLFPYCISCCVFLYNFFHFSIQSTTLPTPLGLVCVVSLHSCLRLPAEPNELNASYSSVIILISHSAPMMHEQHERFSGCQTFSYFSVFITTADCQAKLSMVSWQ